MKKAKSKVMTRIVATCTGCGFTFKVKKEDAANVSHCPSCGVEGHIAGHGTKATEV